MQTENANFLTKKLVKELAFEIKHNNWRLEPYAELIQYWGLSFQKLAGQIADNKGEIINEKGFIYLAELFFYDFVFAFNNGYLIEGGYKATWTTKDKRIFLDAILDANHLARNSEENGDEFLHKWEIIFSSVNFKGYDIDKILKDVFGKTECILNDSHLLDSDYPNEREELNRMYEAQNKIGG